MEFEKIIKLPYEKRLKLLNSKCMFNIIDKTLKMAKEDGAYDEYFWFIGLDDEYDMICWYTNKPNLVDVIGLFENAIKGVKHVILARNVKDSNIQPVEKDLEILEEFIKVGKILHKEIAEYLIISDSGYTSLEIEGYIEKVRDIAERKLSKLSVKTDMSSLLKKGK